MNRRHLSRGATLIFAAALSTAVCHAQETSPARNTPGGASGQNTPEPRQPGETPNEPVSIQATYWFTGSQPKLRGGKADIETDPDNLNFTGTGNRTPEITVSIPAGRGNALRVSYSQTTGNGNQTAATTLAVFSVGYSAGDYLATNYRMKRLKLSYDFLSYPTPLQDSRWRFRTLWEVQYVSNDVSIDAPLKPISVDSSGTPVSNNAAGTKRLILPAFGAALDRKLSDRFRVEAKATGFGLPHRADVWDAEASASYSLGKVDVMGGYRAFHYKTSPQSDYYLAQTIYGGYVALRWNFK